MNQTLYSTKDIADAVGVHVNTVRFYEEIGFITAPERGKNGYRIYTPLQLDQCRLVRVAMKAEVMQNGLRAKAVEIVRLCAELSFEKAEDSANNYIKMIEAEINNAKAATETVENILCRDHVSDGIALKRREAAERLKVTPETLRTWERNGLLTVGRRQNGYRVYNTADMERLNIIRTLRCADYSLSAILRLLNGLDRGEVSSVEETLNSPEENEDIIYVCDRLTVSLNSTKSDALLLRHMVCDMKEKYCTIQ